jgi:hypothetical protein
MNCWSKFLVLAENPLSPDEIYTLKYFHILAIFIWLNRAIFSIFSFPNPFYAFLTLFFFLNPHLYTTAYNEDTDVVT